MSSSPAILPARYRPAFARFFGRYTTRLFEKKFHALRVTPEAHDLLDSLDSRGRPLLIATNHVGWWDPLLCLVLHQRFLSARSAAAPMELEQRKKFNFFRHLGIFGLSPEHPDATNAMRDYVDAYFTSDPKPTLWITPQGRFADVRAPIELRPGVAAIAARLSSRPGGTGVPPASHPSLPPVIALVFEYAFWIDQKPEVFIHARSVELTGEPSTAHWFRALERAMADAAAHLASLVIARDPAAFRTVLGGQSKINPAMDLWLKFTGRSARLESSRDTRPNSSRP